MLSKTSVLSIALVIFASPLAADGQSNDPKTPKDADTAKTLSVLDALQMNNMAVQSCDVLFWTEIYADMGEAGYESVRSTTRLVIDIEKKRCVQIQWSERDYFLADDEKDNEPSRTQALSIAIVSDNTLSWRDWPRTQYSISVPGGFFAALARHGIATFHFVGICEFPVPAAFVTSNDVGQHPLGVPEEFWGMYRNIWAKTFVERHQPNFTIKASPKTNSKGFTIESTTQFDSLTMLPERKSIFLVESGEKKRISNEFINWSEREGIYLPIRLSTDKLASTTTGEKKQIIEYERNRVDTLNWLHINEAVPEEYFDVALINDPARSTALLDPAREGVDQPAPWKIGSAAPSK